MEKTTQIISGEVIRESYDHLDIIGGDITGSIHITYRDPEVILRQGNSVLHLKKDEDVENDYETPYGVIKMKAKATRMHASVSRFHLSYSLSQEETFVKVAIHVRWRLIEDEAIH